ncbi:hypothetical protein RRX38_19610 [Pseudomonas sp. DTU_2021_1001937_2_SI_NGA_ILE_001]|uniref:hypothetical protein n=1 Tax=Pseudomonas sp. DTU_2021_1001937_2_SI_NGA_ILE_001 TaxID=3077589 RepID=UPI0028FC1223|nr:hypothetical protein [Pseudomonas sp. DTU_2021_1001937_2_SI_NGA_ILE_001]WNW13271.1 hypothetical protein RRX38_19610 [Pseudomonas sp. DTU_2021_1001937_2_SI_NGA_ILE_001]
MPTYMKDRSFVASLRSMAPNDAQLDLSKLTQDSIVVKAPTGGPETRTSEGTEEYDYLTATTRPRMGVENESVMRFWFLLRRWDDGKESYELKARHPMFLDNAKRHWLGNLKITNQRVSLPPSSFIDIPLYIRPDQSLASNGGWQVLHNDKPIGPQALVTGTRVEGVKIIAPNGNALGIYNRQRQGTDWWAWISCARPGEPNLAYNTVPITLALDIQASAMDDPLA